MVEPTEGPLQEMVDRLADDAPAAEVSESFGRLIEALDKEAFDALLDDIPSEIAEAQPADFEEFDGVTVAQLAKRAGLSG